MLLFNHNSNKVTIISNSTPLISTSRYQRIKQPECGPFSRVWNTSNPFSNA